MSSIGTLFARLRAWGTLGYQFGRKRDLYGTFGYKTLPMHQDFMQYYTRHGIARRVINAPVSATWADHPIINAGGDTAFVEAWNKFVVEQRIYTVLAKLDRFAGLGMYAVALLGFDDTGKLDQPVTRARKLLYIQPYLEGNVEIVQYDEDNKSPRYGMPLMYDITPGDILGGKNTTILRSKQRSKIRVHHSRILHVADNTLEYPFLGASRLEPCLNTLDDLMKITGGSAETYWLTANRGMQVDIDKEMELDEEDEKSLSDELDEYQHELRRIIRTRGVKINNLGSDLADSAGPFGVAISELSATTGIPQRILMGAEAGQLASQQDRANWADRIAERIADWAEPYILRPFIDKLIAVGILKAPSVPYTIEWPDPFKMNPLERAQSSAQMARSAINIARVLTEAQKGGYALLSIDECRAIIAPSSRVPVLPAQPVGVLPPAMGAKQKADIAKTKADTAKTEAEADAILSGPPSSASTSASTVTTGN